VLGIPDNSCGCLFDLDGVLTLTARAHAAASPEMFDDFLRQRSRRTAERFVPFDPVAGLGGPVAGIVVRDPAELLDAR
jgi:phosphoglycolate phosphatase-like HAD superfamily hydrolase